MPGVRAYYTVRGEAGTPYTGFSVCGYTGDSPEHVAECRARLAEFIGDGAVATVIPRQTHSVNVLTVDATSATEPADTDALVTRTPGVVIGVNTADCVPVLMVDPGARVLAVAHAGWRGAVGGVAANTLAAMISLGARADRVRVAFGPSICPDCFEVGDEVADRFAGSAVMRRPGWARPHVDLHLYLTEQLVARGVERRNIMPFDPSLCTRCHPDRFFSARRLGTASGRVFTFAYLD